MLLGDVSGPGRDRLVVIPVKRVVDTSVIADRGPALVREGDSSDDGLRGSLVEVNTGDRGSDPTVLNHVLDTRRTTTLGWGCPLREYPYPHVLSHPYVLKRAAPSEVLDVDTCGRFVDVDLIEQRFGGRGPCPETGPGAAARMDPPDDARIANPHAGLAPPIRGSRNRSRHSRHGQVGQFEGLIQPREPGVIRIDEHAVVRKVARDDPRSSEALWLADDQPRPDGPVATKGDIDHGRVFRSAPDQDLGPVYGLFLVPHVEDQALERAAGGPTFAPTLRPARRMT